MRNVYSTTGLDGDEKRCYWNNSLNRVCGNFLTSADDWDTFFGHIDVRSVAGLDIAGLSLNARSVVRSRRQIAQSDDTYCFLIMQLAGSSLLIQRGNEAFLRPGDMALLDSGFPSEFKYDGPLRQLSVHLPRRILESRLKTRSLPCSTRITGRHGMGAVTGNFIRSLYDGATELSSRQSDAIHASFLDMINTTLAPVGGTAASLVSNKVAQLSRLQRFIDDRLADPDLTPGKIAKAYGISTRHLHRLFQATDESVGEWMRRRRLEHARNDLADPAHAGCSVTEIAFTWGFNDASHFSRTFRAAFGMSPRQYRNQYRNQFRNDPSSTKINDIQPELRAGLGK